MKKNYFTLKVQLIGLCALIALGCSPTTNASFSSPDKQTTVSVTLNDNGELSYSVTKGDDTIVAESKLGFELKDAPNLSENFEITNVAYDSFDQTWEQPWGEAQFVRNNYNEMIVNLQEKTELKRQLNVIFRLFDDGFGFRYEFPEQANLTDFAIMDEKTEFNLTMNHDAWWLPASETFYESLGRNTPLNEIDTVCTPLTLEGKDGRFYAIHEANLTDYAKMNLYVSDQTKLNVDLIPWADGTKVYASTPFVSPWRTMIIGDNISEVVASKIMLNLNEPSVIEDTSWIKPCKYIGIWWTLHLGNYTWYYGPKHGATTERTKEYMDFAAANGFGGVLVEGWNLGWEGDWVRNKNISFTQAYPDFDMEEIAKHGAKLGVELVGHHETAANSKNYEAQMDDAFALYQKNGVHQVKTGNVNTLRDDKEQIAGQYGVRHTRKVIETAAKYEICINEHETIMPTGLCRTWPNYMTGEGVRGQEHNAWNPDGGNPPQHTTVVPFIRGLAGPMDFTFGTFDFENKMYPGTRVQTTLAKQLALYVVIYSPLQMASDLPENYKGKAFDFIRDVPTDWYESHVLDAVIGDYVVTARRDRNSEDWFLGAITDEDARELTVELSFLDPDAKYIAQIYADGAKAEWKSNPTSFKYEEYEVDSTQSLNLKLATSGGTAIKFKKL